MNMKGVPKYRNGLTESFYNTGQMDLSVFQTISLEHFHSHLRIKRITRNMSSIETDDERNISRFKPNLNLSNKTFRNVITQRNYRRLRTQIIANTLQTANSQKT